MIFKDFSAQKDFWIQNMEFIQDESKEAKHLVIMRMRKSNGKEKNRKD